MYHFSNHQLYHQNTYQQQCPMFVDQTKYPCLSTVSVPAGTTINQFTTVHPDLASIQPEISEIPPNSETLTSCTEKKKKVAKVVGNKSSVDTSNFSIEERLVAAVWVHERKNTKSSMSQIKHDFRQRFGREPPAKNTLLVWERKLFSTGSMHDAPRPGRPVNRRSRVAEVAASVRAAPALSLRARALALRLPRTTLRTILHNDLSPAHTNTNDTGQTTQGRHQTTRNMKKPVRRKLDHQVESGVTCSPLARSAPTRETYF